MVNLKSEKMTHTFHLMNSRYLCRYKLDPTTSAVETASLFGAA
jgi:hypothetical protein